MPSTSAPQRNVRLGQPAAPELAQRGVVAAGDQVADHVAEVVGEGLVERSRLAGVDQVGRGVGDAVGDLVGGHVDLDEVLEAAARGAVDHLRSGEAVVEVGVAEVGAAEVDRRDQRRALVVPRAPAERGVVVVDGAADRVRGHGLAVAERRRPLVTRLPGSLALVEAAQVVGLDAALAGRRVVGRRGRVDQRDHAALLHAGGGDVAHGPALAGHRDGVALGGGDPGRREQAGRPVGPVRRRHHRQTLHGVGAHVDDGAGLGVDVVGRAEVDLADVGRGGADPRRPTRAGLRRWARSPAPARRGRRHRRPGVRSRLAVAGGDRWAR